MQNTALLVIDFINDIVNPKGKIASSAEFVKSNHVIENANKMIAYARKNNMPIGFVKVGFSESYAECPKDSPIFGKAPSFGALMLNSWGTEFDDQLDFKKDDFVIIKHRVSAFYGTSLAPWLHANKINTIMIAGVSTEMTVQTTAREAHDRDFQVIIIEDACGAATQEAHDNSIKQLSRIAVIKKSSEF